jgi:hypothetical protein
LEPTGRYRNAFSGIDIQGGNDRLDSIRIAAADERRVLIQLYRQDEEPTDACDLLD